MDDYAPSWSKTPCRLLCVSQVIAPCRREPQCPEWLCSKNLGLNLLVEVVHHFPHNNGYMKNIIVPQSPWKVPQLSEVQHECKWANPAIICEGFRVCASVYNWDAHRGVICWFLLVKGCLWIKGFASLVKRNRLQLVVCFLRRIPCKKCTFTMRMILLYKQGVQPTITNISNPLLAVNERPYTAVAHSREVSPAQSASL